MRLLLALLFPALVQAQTYFGATTIPPLPPHTPIVYATSYTPTGIPCTWNSTHDVGTCINSAIGAVAAKGGGTVMLPCGTFGLSTQVVNSTSGVSIRGCGVGMPDDTLNPHFNAITKLVWIGSPTANPAVLDYTVPGGATVVTHNTDLWGFTVDCNDICDVAIKIFGVTYSFINVGAINPRVTGVWFSTPTDVESLGVQHNNIWAYGRCDSSTYSPTCILFDQTTFPSTNFSYNTIREVFAYYNKGDGIVFGSSDNNYIENIYMRRTSGATGQPIVCANTAYTMPNGNTLVGYCRDNRFLHLSGGLHILGYNTGSTITAGTHVGTANPTTIVMSTTADSALSTSTLTFADTSALTAGLSVSCGGPVNGVFNNSPVQQITSATVVTIYGETIKLLPSGTSCTFSYGILNKAHAGTYTLTATAPTVYTLTAPVGGNTQSGISPSGGFLTFTDMVIPWTGTASTNDTWTIVIPTPANKIAVDWVDKDNQLPIPTFEPGTSGYWRSSDRLYPLGWNLPCIIGASKVTGAAGGGGSPEGQSATGAGSCILGGQGNIASGANTTVMGGAGSTASGFAATVTGQNNIASGTDGFVHGQAGSDRGRFIAHCMGGSAIAATGDAQTCEEVLQGTGATGSAIRLTANGASASSTNCVNIPNNTAYALTIDIVAFDHSAVTKFASWNGLTALLTRGANAAATALAIASATPAETYSGAAHAGSAMSITADTTAGCLNISWTTPTSNTDTWNVVARVKSVEVQ